MRFQEIAPGVRRARKRATNVYLVDQGGHSVLIDTGEPGFAGDILEALSGRPAVRQILLTHAHYDHAGGAAELSRELSADVFAHPADADLLRRGCWRRPARPAPTLMGRLTTGLIANRFPGRLEAFPEIKLIKDDDALAIDGLRTLALPGHSLGQIGFGVPRSTGGTAWIAGDVIVNVLRLGEPILYEDRTVGLASIAVLEKRVRLGDLICPGHGAPLRVDGENARRLQRLAEG